MSTASQENSFGNDAGLLHQIALSLRAICKDETEARAIATKLAHDRKFLGDVIGLANGKPKRKQSFKGLIDSDLLEPIAKVSLPAVEGFSTKDMLTVGTHAGVKIGWNGDNFKKYFVSLNRTGKLEIDVLAQKLRVHKLRKNSLDGPIITQLGGESVVETNLGTMFELMKKQGTGQAGDLLVNGYANIFYIRDDNGTLWAVSCRWFADLGGWYVEASSLTDPREWDAGIQVFSRWFWVL